MELLLIIAAVNYATLLAIWKTLDRIEGKLKNKQNERDND